MRTSYRSVSGWIQWWNYGHWTLNRPLVVQVNDHELVPFLWQWNTHKWRWKFSLEISIHSNEELEGVWHTADVKVSDKPLLEPQDWIQLLISLTVLLKWPVRSLVMNSNNYLPTQNAHKWKISPKTINDACIVIYSCYFIISAGEKSMYVL
jgi:hypothetical protein